MKHAIKFVLLAMALVFAGNVAVAQVTTSALSGKVVDGNGESVIGAAVVATHEPSGTVYGAITNADGRYTIQGMRSGGPYKVEVSCLGYQEVIYTDITLILAETYNLNASVKESSEFLSEAVVISEAVSKFAQEKTGAATNINNSQILALPTVSRSITDVTRLSPYGGNGMSFAGTDGRTANFTVDGANFNNNFGLSSNLPGGGNPISLDAIQELQVVISPYDVRQTNFIGGGVNAVTKSGTNTFKGTAYVYHRNENLRGDTIYGHQIPSAREKDRTTIYGMTFGGPIIKNKLFFFVNAEQTKIPSVVNRWKGSEDGVADVENFLSRTTLSDLERVSKHVMDKYGYNTGSYTDFPADESNTKFLVRLDWNINDKHKLAIRYNYTLNKVWNSPNATSMDGGTRASGSRMSQYSMSFANSMYSMDNYVKTFSVDLNSRLSDNLSNQFLATFSKLDDIRGSNSSEFPFIDILAPDETGNDNNYMALGYELFTWNNAVHNTVANVKDDLTFFFGSHKLMAGFNFEYQMADNQYMRNGTGYYRYKSVDDFINGATPEVVCLTYGYDGESKPAARVQSNKLGIYAQDDWQASDKLKLTYGLRIDGLFYNNDDLMTNQAIKDLKYFDNNGKERHIDTGKWPSAKVTLSPRVGFIYDVFGNKTLKVRGGTGLFSGRLPLVFFTNMPTNGGLVQYQAQLNAKTKIFDGKKNEWVKGFENYSGTYTSNSNGDRYLDMTQFNGGLVTDANGNANIAALYNKLTGIGYPTTVSPKDGVVPSAICGVVRNFKMPQVWKTSLAVDYVIPVSFPLSVSAEGIVKKTINDVTITDWAIPSVGGFSRFNGADNRPIYPDDFRTNAKAFMLENTSKGYGYSLSFSVNASPVEGLDLMAAYTRTASKELTGMPGSAAESAFTYVPTKEGPNHIRLHNSQYVTPDRFVASLNYSDKSNNHYSFIYEAWKGGYNYSYMLTNDMNGDGYKYDALYIPTDAQVVNGDFRFASEDDAERFMSYVHKDVYLSKHQGEYAEPYSLYSPWVNRLDFSYKHDFKVRIAGSVNTLQISFDVKNVLNLFNSKWGVSKILNPVIGQEARILNYDGVDADGYAVFSTPKSVSGSTPTFVPATTIGQLWYASIGIKYMFN
ncbi:Carboxypeptidase regulatory-like domain-containing protein [Bacteroidales bacterium WCE2008]|nr:Carboxypeptidase regulatory-like domain-containing protein [Bacteroidales bacterium WCE2008]